MDEGITRAIDDIGRIVLPQEIRSAVGAKDKDVFRVEQVGHNKIQLTLLKDDTCIQCNSTKNVVKTPFGYICESCLYNLLTNYFHEKVDDKMDQLYDVFFLNKNIE